MTDEQNVHHEEHTHVDQHTGTVHSAEHSDATRQLEAFRRQKDKFLAEHPQSPLLPDDKEQFRGANYFPVDLKYRVVATLVPETNPGIFRVQTSTGDHKEYTRVGRLEFEI